MNRLQTLVSSLRVVWTKNATPVIESIKTLGIPVTVTTEEVDYDEGMVDTSWGSQPESY